MTADDLIARHAIRNTLARHSQGVGRADANLLASAYRPDARVDCGFFARLAATLVKILAAAQKAALPTLHRTFTSDWTAAHPASFEPAGFYEGLTTRGCFGRIDPIYKRWESL